MLSFCILYHDDDEQYLQGNLDSIPEGQEIILVKTTPTKEVIYQFPIIKPLQVIEGNPVKHHEYLYYKDIKSPYDYKNNTFNFADARNKAASMASGRFIVSLDADERISIEKDEIEALEKLPESVGGIQVSLHSYANEPDPVRITRPLLRIYMNGLQYIHRCHEQILPAIQSENLQVVDTSILIKHIGYQATEKHVDKMLRNVGMMSTDLIKNPLDEYVCERTFVSLEWLLRAKIYDCELPKIAEMNNLQELERYGVTVKKNIFRLGENIRSSAIQLERNALNHQALKQQFINLFVSKQMGGFNVNK
jgi:glycosyltransferase involved in cell wall biosynthesis